MSGEKVANWVSERFTISGGDIKLGGIQQGFASFSSAFSSGDQVFYACSDESGNRESGIATYQVGKLTNRQVTSTYLNRTYNDTNPTPLSFSNGGTVAVTLNASEFQALWDAMHDSGDHHADSDNPHNVTAPQVDLDPVLQLLANDAQNVQGALEYTLDRLFVKVSDDKPSNPVEGDLWADTGATAELYVYLDGQWVSMTGAGGNAGNFTTDDVDGTKHYKALAREINEDGEGVWRQILSDDIIPAGGATNFSADGSLLRTQSDINQFLYDTAIDNSGGGGSGGSYDDTQIKADLAKETQDRIDGDAQLQTNLNKEEADRKKEDKDLQDQIDAIPPPVNTASFVGKKGEQSMEGPLEIAGSLEVKGGIDADGTRISNVASPVFIHDAVNKQYADAVTERLLTYQTAPTNMSIDRYVDAAHYDEKNHRILMWRNYFGITNQTPQPHLLIGDPATGDVVHKECPNPMATQRREPLSCPFHVGDDIVFVHAENPKDSPPIKLTPDGDFSHYGDLKFCRSWAVINYHVPLSEQYHLFIGNPSMRLDPNGGNGSSQAQATLFLDTEDLINQNQIESYENSGTTYGTITKSISTSRGGIPAVITKGQGVFPDVYLFQPGKVIHRIEITDPVTKTMKLTGAGGHDLPIGYLVDYDGTRIAQQGHINGLTVLQNRYVVWHALHVGIMWFDTVTETLDNIYPTDNWIEYGCNKHKTHPNVPNIGDTLYFFPGDHTGHDRIDVAPEMLVVNSDKSVNAIAVPDPEFKSTNSQRSTALEIVSFDQSGNMTAYNVNDRRFERYEASEDLQTAIGVIDPETGEMMQKIIPVCKGSGQDPNSYRNCRILELKESISEEIIADLNLLANPIIEDHENDIDALLDSAFKNDDAIAQVNINGDSIDSTRDGLADMIAANVMLATEDEDYLQSQLMEHAFQCWPDSDHPLYHLVAQDYILMTRMYEGSKKTEDDDGNIITNNQSLDSDNYGNDDLSNVLILHIPTGKIKDISTTISHNHIAVDENGNKKDKQPALRGHTVMPRDNGDVDIYSWIHNPRRNPKSESGAGQPLHRIHIPANADWSDPFAGVTTQHTNIYCDPALMTTPAKNPYGNYTDETLKFQYEISQTAWSLIDSATGRRHYFMMSYNKGSKDYVTQRVFEINFDESNPDYGTITPVQAHPDSTHGEYAAGWHAIKKDVNDVYRCFLYGSPVGLTELYFTGSYPNRTPEIRNYGDYTPQGVAVHDPDALNGIGKPVIVGKGIVDNWYKGSTLAPQFINTAPIDNDDYFSNVMVWYQTAYGLCSLNIQDLGVEDRSGEVRLENNYQGSEMELSSMAIETKKAYDSYLQDGSSRNLMRFNVRQPDTRSHGSLYFFDYKADYMYNTDASGNITSYGSEQTLYNSSRRGEAGNNGFRQDQILFKRSILEVRPNYKTGRIEVHAIVVGAKHHPSGEELGYHETFSGESVAKFGDVFVCSAAAKSHSSLTEPRVYIFDPQFRQIQRVSNIEVNSTSLISCPDHGLVIGSSYGIDSQDNNTPVYMTSMLNSDRVVSGRDSARVLRKLCEVTGEDPAKVKGTWALDKKESN